MADQQRQEAELRGWLDSVAAPPPRLDLDQIVQTGRAQARRRRHLVAGGAAATVLAVAIATPMAAQAWRSGEGSGPIPPPGGPAAVACEVTELRLPDDLPERGVPDPTTIRIRAMDPTGRFVIANGPAGEQAAPDASPVMVRWDGGDPAYLPAPRGTVQAHDVNARGVVVGAGWDGARGYGWVYDERLRELPAPDGYRRVEVAGINQAGDVAGTAYGAEDEAAVVVWPADDRDRPRVLPAPAGREIAAVGITDDGTVVGGFADRQSGGYRWDADGVGSELPLPDWATGGGLADVRGDWVVGEAGRTIPTEQVDPSSGQRAASDLASLAPSQGPSGQLAVTVPIRWSLTTGVAAEIPGYELDGELLNQGGVTAVAVNAAGDVVIGYPGPAVLRDGRPYSLPVPMPLAIAGPVTISDDGTVVAGAAIRPDGTASGQLVWHCQR